MSVKQEALRAAVLGALRDLIDGEYQHARGTTLDELLELQDATGTKSIDVKLPNGMPVASITLVDPSDEAKIVDRAAFTRWVQERAPEMVEQEPAPLERVSGIIHAFGVPDHLTAAQAQAFRRDIALEVLAELGIDPDPPEPRVSRVYEEGVLADLQPVDTDPGTTGQAVLGETGEIVPGVEYRTAGKPSKIQMRFKPNGRASIASAWRDNQLPPVEGLPEIQS